MIVVLSCLSAEAARTVADECPVPGVVGRERLSVRVGYPGLVAVVYEDDRYPVGVALWAAENGYASSSSAARVVEVARPCGRGGS